MKPDENKNPSEGLKPSEGFFLQGHTLLTIQIIALQVLHIHQ